MNLSTTQSSVGKMMSNKLHEDVSKIREMMNLVTESADGCKYENWSDGDGITKPKITYTLGESECEFIYEGPETGFCIDRAVSSTGDTIHQLSNIAAKKTGEQLKKLYKEGKFVSAYCKEIEMEYKEKYFRIKIPLLSTKQDIATTSIDHRGGMNHTSDPKNFFTKLKDILQSDVNVTIISEKEDIVAKKDKKNYIIEHWIAWQDSVWMEKNPPKKVDPTPTPTQNNTQPNTPEKKPEPIVSKPSMTTQGPKKVLPKTSIDVVPKGKGNRADIIKKEE